MGNLSLLFICKLMNYKCRDNQACVLWDSFLTLQRLNSEFILSGSSCLFAEEYNSINYRK